MRKIVVILGAILISSCSPQRKLMELELKHPKLLITHCIERYPLSVGEATFDTVEVFEEPIEVISSSGEKIPCPPTKIKTITKEVKVEDTRRLKLGELTIDSLRGEIVNLREDNIKSGELLKETKDKLKSLRKALFGIIIAGGLGILYLIKR